MATDSESPQRQIRWFSSDIARSINLLTYLLTVAIPYKENAQRTRAHVTQVQITRYWLHIF